jgi:hypothetical protein
MKATQLERPKQKDTQISQFLCRFLLGEEYGTLFCLNLGHGWLTAQGPISVAKIK